MAVETRTNTYGCEVFTIAPDELWDHYVGNPHCRQGWCGSEGYPKLCEVPGCGGKVHADFFEEYIDGYSLSTRCDRCGESE